MNNSNHGFTLVEVMVALSIFAVTAGAIAVSNVQSTANATQIEDKVAARLIAENFLTELRLSETLPDDGSHHEKIEFNGRNWVIDYRVDNDELPEALVIMKPYLKRIDLNTRLESEENHIDTLIAYLGVI